MVIARVDRNWACRRKASPGSRSTTSAGVAPQRRCHPLYSGAVRNTGRSLTTARSSVRNSRMVGRTSSATWPTSLRRDTSHRAKASLPLDGRAAKGRKTRPFHLPPRDPIRTNRINKALQATGELLRYSVALLRGGPSPRQDGWCCHRHESSDSTHARLKSATNMAAYTRVHQRSAHVVVRLGRSTASSAKAEPSSRSLCTTQQTLPPSDGIGQMT